MTLPGGTQIEVPVNSTIKPDGTIVTQNGPIINTDGSITVPGQNEDSSIQIPSVEGNKPSINDKGEITIPGSGGTVILPGDVEVKVPGGATVSPEGNISVPGVGEVELPGGGSIIVPQNTLIKPNGSIVVPEGESIMIPQQDGNSVVIRPSKDSDSPSFDNDGNITLNGGSIVELPNGSIIEFPSSGVINPENAEVTLPNGGSLILPNGGETIIVKPGTVINPDGTIKNPPQEDNNDENNNGDTETKPDVKPSIFDKIDTDVVDIIGTGNGQASNPIILTVKEADKIKLNNFLNNLKDLNPKVTSISKGYSDIEYKLEVDNKNIPLKEKTYVIINVHNNKTDLVKILNKFSKQTNEKVEIPILVSFIDVTQHWAKTNIDNFASMGIINGYEDGTFKPNESITRAEFVKVVNSAFGYTQPGVVTFTDVKKEDWFYNEIAIAKHAGYINGKTDSIFAPNDKITREEVAKILTTIMKNKEDKIDKLNKFPDGNNTSDWAKPYVEGAIKAGYLSGDTDGYLNPINNITRAEAVTVLSRIK